MLAKVKTATVLGLDGIGIDVEVDVRKGNCALTIVGLPDKAVQESRDRVITAVKNSEADFPLIRTTINLAPADIPKEGPSYDLPIAIGVLAASGQVQVDSEKQLFIGELALDGKLRFVNGILPIADFCRSKKIPELFVPHDNAYEASLIPGVTVYPVETLQQLISHLNKERLIEPFSSEQIVPEEDDILDVVDFQYVRGQQQARRAVEIAAAGSHNLLMNGTPGSGKTMIARCIPSILPKMSIDESLEVSRIYSVAGLLAKDTPLVRRRPFRKPHHTISDAALVGGGRIPKPGEISLSHRGVLFLDEFPEFPSKVLETLRQPLEDKIVTISRASGTLSYPTNFMMVAAMNPCKCGWKGDPERECTCSQNDIQRYAQKISGPILDRIDLKIFVPRVEYEKLQKDELGESSAEILKRVENARNLQRERFANTKFITNCEMGTKEINNFCKLSDPCKTLLKKASERFLLSARSYFRIIKVARTIADIENSGDILESHIAEALQYRMGE